MNKKVVKFLINIGAKVSKLWDPMKEPTKIKKEYNCNPAQFSGKLNAMEYKSDPLGGFIDYVADPNTFFDEKNSGRDCDDFQRQWSWYGVYNGYEVKEFVISNPTTLQTTFSTMHIIGVLKKNNQYYLTNYYYYGPFDSEEKALNYMKHFSSYKNNVIVPFRTFKKRTQA